MSKRFAVLLAVCAVLGSDGNPALVYKDEYRFVKHPWAHHADPRWFFQGRWCVQVNPQVCVPRIVSSSERATA